jgi:hypothetical protein
MTDPKDVLKRLREAENREIQQIRRAGGERHFLYLFRDAAEVIESLTASQARGEIVEGIKSTFLASTIEGPCVWVSFETTQCAERFIASLKTGERDAG